MLGRTKSRERERLAAKKFSSQRLLRTIAKILVDLGYFDLTTVTTYTFLIFFDKAHQCGLTHIAQEALLDIQSGCLRRTGMLKSTNQYKYG